MWINYLLTYLLPYLLTYLLTRQSPIFDWATLDRFAMIEFKLIHATLVRSEDRLCIEYFYISLHEYLQSKLELVRCCFYRSAQLPCDSKHSVFGWGGERLRFLFLGGGREGELSTANTSSYFPLLAR